MDDLRNLFEEVAAGRMSVAEACEWAKVAGDRWTLAGEADGIDLRELQAEADYLARCAAAGVEPEAGYTDYDGKYLPYDDGIPF
jgi:hypothetical protein